MNLYIRDEHGNIHNFEERMVQYFNEENPDYFKTIIARLIHILYKTNSLTIDELDIWVNERDHGKIEHVIELDD